MTGVGSSTGNLNRHLKLHPDKTDPSVKKQSEFMMNFLDTNKSKQQVINIIILSILYLIYINYYKQIFIAIFNENFREKLAIWISADDQPFNITESYEFRDLIRLCNPNAFIPTGDTIKHDVLKMFKSYQINVQNLLQVSKYLKIKNFLFNLTNLNFLNQRIPLEKLALR